MMDRKFLTELKSLLGSPGGLPLREAASRVKRIRFDDIVRALINNNLWKAETVPPCSSGFCAGAVDGSMVVTSATIAGYAYAVRAVSVVKKYEDVTGEVDEILKRAVGHEGVVDELFVKLSSKSGWQLRQSYLAGSPLLKMAENFEAGVITVTDKSEVVSSLVEAIMALNEVKLLVNLMVMDVDVVVVDGTLGWTFEICEKLGKRLDANIAGSLLEKASHKVIAAAQEYTQFVIKCVEDTNVEWAETRPISTQMGLDRLRWIANRYGLTHAERELVMLCGVYVELGALAGVLNNGRTAYYGAAKSTSKRHLCKWIEQNYGVHTYSQDLVLLSELAARELLPHGRSRCFTRQVARQKLAYFYFYPKTTVGMGGGVYLIEFFPPPEAVNDEAELEKEAERICSLFNRLRVGYQGRGARSLPVVQEVAHDWCCLKRKETLHALYTTLECAGVTGRESIDRVTALKNRSREEMQVEVENGRV